MSHTRLFVYGSLKLGFWNHGYLERAKAEFMGNSILYDHTILSDGQLPFLVHKDGAHVNGEVYLVPDEGMKIIRQLERGYEEIVGMLENGTIAIYYHAPAYVVEGEDFKDIGHTYELTHSLE